MTGQDAAAGAVAGPRVVVIGGGIGGLAAAALLARGGARVTLLERHARVGGRAGLLEVDGFTFDTGPSWYLMPEAFDQFFALLGRTASAELDLVDLDPRYRVFFESERADGVADVLDVSADPDTNYARFNAMSAGDGDAMRAYAAESEQLYRLALGRFLYTTFQNPLKVVNLRVLAQLPRLVSLLTRSLGAKVASKVSDHRLQQILGFHAVFLGSSPRRVPSLFSLMSHLDLTDGVRYPRAGMYALIEALRSAAESEGVRIHTEANVTRILINADGLACGVETSQGAVFDADVVVSGADLHHTETALVEPKHQTHPERTWANRGPGVSALLVMAGVEGELPQLAHHSLFFTRDWEANFDAIVGDGALSAPFPASVYASRVTATNAATAPAGHENLYLLVPFPADPALGADAASRADMEAAAWRYIEQIGTWAQIPRLRERTTIYRITTPADFATNLNSWRGSALGLEHSVRQSALFRPGNVSKKVPNLLYVGASTTPGIGMPICLISAELVAKRLLGSTGVGPLPAPASAGFLTESTRKDVLGQIVRGERTVAPDPVGA